MPRAGPSSERPATRACGLPGLAPNLPAPPWVPRLGVGVGGGAAPGRRGNPGELPADGLRGGFPSAAPAVGRCGEGTWGDPSLGWGLGGLLPLLPSAPSHLTRRPESPAFCPSSFCRRWVGVCVGARLWGRPWARSCLLPFSLARLGLRCPCSGESHGTAARWLSAVTLWVCVNINCWEFRKARFSFIGCYWVFLPGGKWKKTPFSPTLPPFAFFVRSVCLVLFCPGLVLLKDGDFQAWSLNSFWLLLSRFGNLLKGKLNFPPFIAER